MVRQHVIPVAVALIVGYLMRYTEPRSRVVWWFPAALQFNFPFVTLARREWVSLQVLSAQGAPPLVTVIRSEDGPAIRVATIQQLSVPLPRRLFFLALMAIGALASIYWGTKILLAMYRMLQGTGAG